MCSRFIALNFLLLLALPEFTRGQATSPTPTSDAANLTGLTTPIDVDFSDHRILSGSGFFYMEFGPDDPTTKGPHWRTITHLYVVTAKHLIQPKRLRDLVKLTYAMRSANGEKVEWLRFDLNGEELGKRLHVCKREEIDVAVIDVTGDLATQMKQPLAQRAQLLSFNGANADEFPGKSPLEVQPGDDVIVIGYPQGFYDQYNKLPILKTGLLNTPINLHFDGLDAFLIDFKYYEGSSGSLIISKPSHFGFSKDGLLQTSEVRRYVFLGVYQGEWYRNEDQSLGADLGLGWYYYNVEEAIKNPPLAH